MSEIGGYFDDLEEYNKQRKANNLSTAYDDGEWTKHTPFHWTRMLAGKKLQYWPSTNKFQWGKGPVQYGGIEGFINRRTPLD